MEVLRQKYQITSSECVISNEYEAYGSMSDKIISIERNQGQYQTKFIGIDFRVNIGRSYLIGFDFRINIRQSY